jgi:uncharacterized delta-60 repeat protein
MAQRVVFIDENLSDYAQIVAGLPEGAEWHLIGAGEDGLARMAQLLEGRGGLDAIDIVSHGAPGMLRLGATTLTLDDIAAHQPLLEQIGQSLAEGGDLLLYGCAIGAGATGRDFIRALAAATGADVAASDDATGLGGDWRLEAGAGAIEAAPLEASGYAHRLAADFASGGGIVTTALGPGDDQGRSVLIQPDGKILVAGYSWYGSKNDFALVRYNADGSLDTTFDGDGKLTTAFSSDSKIYSVALQPDGKILVAGNQNNGSTDYFTLARYNSYGTLDSSFSGSGAISVSFGSSSKGSSVILQPDGKILAAGGSWNGSNWDFALFRLNSNGSFDTSFDGDGGTTTAIGASNDEGYSAILQPDDGKIVVGGLSWNGSNWDFALVRYNANGSLDTTFDGDGRLTTAIGAGDDRCYSLALQPDNKILAAGYSWNGGNWDFALVRYNANGSLDTTFDGDGKLTTALGFGDAYGSSLALQADGKILLAGHSWNGSNYDFALVRYNVDGSLDTSFSGDGKSYAQAGSYDDNAFSLALQPSGVILVAGSSWNGSNWDFALARLNRDGKTASGIIEGGSGNDWLVGTDATDSIFGRNGDDLVIVTMGNDTFDGGAGTDTMAFLIDRSVFTITKWGDAEKTLTVADPWGGYYTLKNVEYLSFYDETVRVSDLYAASFIEGNEGIDTLFGTTNNDTVLGNAGNDRLTGKTGNDTLDGGAGIDTAVFSGTRGQYTLARAASGWSIAGPDGVDTLRNVEFIVFDDQAVGLLNTGNDGRTDVSITKIFLNGAASACLRSDGSVVAFGNPHTGGDLGGTAALLDGTIDVLDIFSNQSAYAALRSDGSVVSWGVAADGGYSGHVAAQLNGAIDVITIASNESGFAALRADGSVVSWGSPDGGGDSSAVSHLLDGSIDVTRIFNNGSAFAALRADGSVVTWGDRYGGDSSAVSNQLNGAIDVVNIFPSIYAGFSALRADGSVVAWGDSSFGFEAVAGNLDGTIDAIDVVSGAGSSYALRADGSVVAWGGFSGMPHALDGTIDVAQICIARHSDAFFAALRADGSLVQWDRTGVRVSTPALYTKLYSNTWAIAAIKADGSVVAWGESDYGGLILPVQSQLDGTIDVVKIFAAEGSFAALRADGSVVTWGSISDDDRNALTPLLDGRVDVVDILVSGWNSYTAIRADGSMVNWGGGSFVNWSGGGSPFVLGGDSTDNLVGGSNDDLLDGGRGKDSLSGGAGRDVLVGGDGDDILDGGAGPDFLVGGIGDDWYFVDDAGDMVIENSLTDLLNGQPPSSSTGGTIDGVLASIDFTLGLFVENLSLQPGQARIGTGNDSGNVIEGNDNDNQLFGKGSADTLRGKGGNDILDGGDGPDIAVFSGPRSAYTLASLGGNEMTLRVSGPDGTDTLKNIENLAFDDQTVQAAAIGNSTTPIEGGSGNDTLAGTAAADTVFGNNGNDRITGNAGNDAIDGGPGIDTAVYLSARSSYTVAVNGAGITVTSLAGAADGTDQLANVERLQFSDRKLAFDLTPAGHAGMACEFIGILASASLSNPEIVGAILPYFDSGMSMTALSQYAIDIGLVAQLAGSNSQADLVRLLWRNIAGSEAPEAAVDAHVAYMDGRTDDMSRAEFMAAVAGLEVNQTHVNLVGLQATGIAFV